MDTNIFLWDVYGECENYAFLQGHKNAVLEVCWNYDGTELVSVGADKMVCIWDAAVFLHFVYGGFGVYGACRVHNGQINAQDRLTRKEFHPSDYGIWLQCACYYCYTKHRKQE